MKKIITILVLVFASATSFAQYNHQPSGMYNNTSAYRNDVYHNANFERQKEFEIARINRDFNFKVNSIESRIFMGRRKKDMLIREAEMQRDQDIRIIIDRYRGDRNYNR